MNDFLKYFDGSDATTPVLIMLLGAFLLGLIFKSLGCSRTAGLSEEDAVAGATATGGLGAEEIGTSAAAAQGVSVVSSARDNLQVIEGVGPKVEGVLNEAGIETYARLSVSSKEELRGMLDKAGPAYKVIVPDTWPEQSKLADQGKWDELKEYQEYLVGGVDPAGQRDSSSIQPLTGEPTEQLKTGTTVESVAAAAGPDPAKPDNLKIVEGIGPKIEELFHKAGVLTWRDLADSDVDKLRQILREAGSRFQMHDPATWPEQAKLAADGKFDELKKYQDFLQGGKA